MILPPTGGTAANSRNEAQEDIRIQVQRLADAFERLYGPDNHWLIAACGDLTAQDATSFVACHTKPLQAGHLLAQLENKLRKHI